MNKAKQKLLKKVALWDLIIFAILGVTILILQIIIPILSSILPYEILLQVSELNEFANYNRLLFLLFAVIINLIYIFYFRQWKRLLYILYIAIFSIIPYISIIFLALRGIGTSRNSTLLESFIGFVSFLLLVSPYPTVHLFLAWQNYSKKERIEKETL